MSFRAGRKEDHLAERHGHSRRRDRERRRDRDIYTVNADGTGLTQVTNGVENKAPDWGTHPLIP
jgi:hypothetical protein